MYILNNMNEEQEKAVQTLNDTLLIAGAGSGKTFTIINKINHLIDNNIYTEKDILVISFTNESVNDIKRKCNKNIEISTFHKLAINILKDENYHLANNNLLDFIINEYFESFAKFDKKTKQIIPRIKVETSVNYLKQYIKTFINLYKANYTNIEKLWNLYKKSFFINKDYLKIILDIYLIYQRELESSGTHDFNDLIINAQKQIEAKTKKVPYKFIIIDEFQDTSYTRLNLILSIKKINQAKIFFVGDDYQSIYRFCGLDLNIFLNIQKYIPTIEILKLVQNFRNNQETINLANKFIMKNNKQIPKTTICQKNLKKPIKIIYFTNKQTIIKKLTPQLFGTTLIMGRNNKDKEEYNIKESENIKFLTVHKAKGLEFDNTIIINLENKTNGFPSRIPNPKLLDKIISTDSFKDEEERRLFYVALTRSKNYTYLIVPKDNPSVFIKEIKKIGKEYIEEINL